MLVVCFFLSHDHCWRRAAERLARHLLGVVQNARRIEKGGRALPLHCRARFLFSSAPCWLVGRVADAGVEIDVGASVPCRNPRVDLLWKVFREKAALGAGCEERMNEPRGLRLPCSFWWLRIAFC